MNKFSFQGFRTIFNNLTVRLVFLLLPPFTSAKGRLQTTDQGRQTRWNHRMQTFRRQSKTQVGNKFGCWNNVISFSPILRFHLYTHMRQHLIAPFTKRSQRLVQGFSPFPLKPQSSQRSTRWRRRVEASIFSQDWTRITSIKTWASSRGWV